MGNVAAFQQRALACAVYMKSSFLPATLAYYYSYFSALRVFFLLREIFPEFPDHVKIFTYMLS